MSKNEEFKIQFAQELGTALGAILPALFQTPPISPEEAKKTVHELNFCASGIAADGAPFYVGMFLAGIITAIEHYSLQGDDPELEVID